MFKFILIAMLIFLTGPVLAAEFPILPDPVLTPGRTIQVPLEILCQTHYTETVRHVTTAEERLVFKRYNIDIDPKKHGEFEIDHLISLELGGSNDVENLWPQSYNTQPWNARIKDVLETALKRLVCSRKIPLEQAQSEISHNWIEAYTKYITNGEYDRLVGIVRKVR